MPVWCGKELVFWSHPAWGAWIEIISSNDLPQALLTSHPAWGAWIEILAANYLLMRETCRTPHGVRGLKS